MITIRSIAYTLTLATFATAPLVAMEPETLQNEQSSVEADTLYGATFELWQDINSNPKEFVDSLAFLTSKCRRLEDYDLLIKNLSNANFAQIKDKEGKTSLHHAVVKIDGKNFIDSKVVDVLLKAAKDVNEFIAIKDIGGNTALDIANFCNNTDAILLMLNALGKREDANTLICTSSVDGWTVVHNAAMWGRCETLELCFATASTPQQVRWMIDLEDFEHNTPWSLANGDAKVLIQKYIDNLGQ